MSDPAPSRPARETVPAWCVRRLTFPVAFGATFAAAYHFIYAGYSAFYVTPLVLAGFCLFLIPLERYLPFAPLWNTPQADMVADGGFALSEMLLAPVFEATLYLGAVEVNARLTGALQLGLWPARWPGVVQILIAAVICDFFLYWVHRYSHEHDTFLWKLHSVHHSPTRLYWFNSRRQHPIQLVIVLVCVMIPLGLLGVTKEVLSLAIILQSLHSIASHVNIDVRLGPLNWIFNMAEVHRWHHSLILKEANRNYAPTFALWDIVHGTRHYPSRAPFPGDKPVGLSHAGGYRSSSYPKRFLGIVMYPFTWRTYQQAGLDHLRRT